MRKLSDIESRRNPSKSLTLIAGANRRPVVLAPAPVAPNLEKPQEEWMRPPETAAYLKTSTSTLAKQRLRGDGVPYTKFGRNVLYAKRDCDEHLASRRRLSTSDTSGQS